MIPYLQTARDAVTDINSNTQALSNTMEDMQDELDRLYDRLGSLSKSLRSASDELNKGLVSQQTQDAIEKILSSGRRKSRKFWKNSINFWDREIPPWR